MSLIPGTLPSGSCYGTPQDLLELFAQYLDIPAFAVSSKVLYSSVSPSPDTGFVWINTAGADTPLLNLYNDATGVYQPFPFVGGTTSNERLISDKTAITTLTNSDLFLVGTFSGGSYSALKKITWANIVAATPVVPPANGSVTAPMLNGAQTGTAPIFGVRAWVNFNGQVNASGIANTTVGVARLIRASGNVSSVTYQGTGSYDVTFTVPMIDVNYSTHTTSQNNVDGDGQAFEGVMTSKTTSVVRVGAAIATGSATNPQSYHVLILR